MGGTANPLVMGDQSVAFNNYSDEMVWGEPSVGNNNISEILTGETAQMI